MFRPPPPFPRIPRTTAQRSRLRIFFWSLGPSAALGGTFLLLGSLFYSLGVVLDHLFSGLLAVLTWGRAGGWAILILVKAPGAVLVLGGILSAFLPLWVKLGHAASAEEFDQWLKLDVEWLARRGLARLQLELPELSLEADDRTARGRLILTAGLASFDHPERFVSGEAQPAWIVGPDRTRFRLNRMTALYYAEHHVARYVCDFNFETGVLLSERTDEAHLKDVTALTAEQHCKEFVPVPPWWETVKEGLRIFRVSALLLYAVDEILRHVLPRQYVVSRYFGVQLSSGSSLTVPFYSGAAGEGVGKQEELTEANVARMRGLLREKRMQVVRVLTA